MRGPTIEELKDIRARTGVASPPGTTEAILATMPADLAGIVADYLDGVDEPLAAILARGVNRCACGATIVPYIDLCAVCAVGEDEACQHVKTGRWSFTDATGVVRTLCTAWRTDEMSTPDLDAFVVITDHGTGEQFAARFRLTPDGGYFHDTASDDAPPLPAPFPAAAAERLAAAVRRLPEAALD